ncbi:MAG: glycyl-radical enzyme activating protein [Ruminococcaceae bacterium]|nr:glycyl-radical enzyme activating protein [Oscillospiraceae bacterium]
MEGIITNIQRFSLTDGDGIRTTVFFKGCNMNCSWCHNPETIRHHSELLFYETKCIGCGKCFAACPTGAQQVVDGKHVIDRKKCINCGKCTEVCYAEALVMCGEKMSVEDVMYQVRQDKAYYDSSNGGVTLSGGEVLCQKEFAIALSCACHKENIKVAVETNLCFSFDYAKELLERVDLIMCDLKIFDENKHKKYTGVSNKNIIGNIAKLDELNIPIIVRTPLIPCATDSIDNIYAIANHIKNMKNLFRYEVLNFNPLGEGKYKALNAENQFESARPFNEDTLSKIRDVLAKVGVSYKII